MKMSQVKSVYFIGIGGIGMSAIARYFNDNGANVSGYDRTETPLTKQLVQEGISVYYSEDVNRIPKNVDLVVYTPAIPEEHKELVYYQNSEIPTLKRAVVLGQIVNEGQCFAVAGSHGKSTTSAMLAHVFQAAGKNSTAFLGAIASNYESNYIKGGVESFVVEADEYDRSFHQIKPSATIITAVDSDHLDIYGSMEGVVEGFEQYVSGVRADGVVFIEAKEEFKNRIKTKTVFTYSIEQEADYQAKNIRLVDGAYQFDVLGVNGLEILDVRLTMGGRYNIENALAVIALASYYGVSSESIREAFAGFKGLKRRFEVVFQGGGKVFVDDYAHHPNEIRAFIKGVKELFPSQKILAIFQPHLFSRTKDYAEHFAESLDIVDDAMVMNIYPAREEPIEGVTSQLIVDAMKMETVKLVNTEDLVSEVECRAFDVLVTVGAGDISKEIEKLKKIIVK